MTKTRLNLLTNQKSAVVQREVHYDTYSFSAALRSSLRQDPDVVLIGEMRDLETISAAITIAETGHLVFATLHTNSASQSVDRMIDVFPPHQQAQIRAQLSNISMAICSQRLIQQLVVYVVGKRGTNHKFCGQKYYS